LKFKFYKTTPEQEIPVPVLFCIGKHTIKRKGRESMAITTTRTGTTGSIVKGMTVGAIISFIITIIGSIMIASCLNLEKITWEEAGYWIMGMLFLAAFIGGKGAHAVIKRQRIAVSLMTSFLYWGILLCTTALFFGGNFGPLFETAAIILAGCISSSIFRNSFSKNNRRKNNRFIVKLNKKTA
jgi:hypothetical protein